MANMISGVISITIAAVVLANVFVVTIKQTNQTDFTQSEKAMWNLLTLLGIVGLVYGVLAVFGIM
jgi:hypothetical protein